MIGLILLLTASAALAVPTSNQITTQTHDAQWKAVTDGCGETKSCFLYPEDCFVLQNCVAAVSILVVGMTNETKNYTFEMQSVGGVYIAVGLSNDDDMGDDSVVECVSDTASGTGKVSLYASYNKGHSNTREPAATGLTLDTDASSYADNTKTAYCKFDRAEVTTFQGTEFDLSKTQYYLLLAVGSKATDVNIGFHNVAVAYSADARYVADIGYYQHPPSTTADTTSTSTTTAATM